MSDSMSGKQALMRYGSLVAGPLLCLIIFLAMPSSYVTADGSVAEFSQAGRACLGVLVWMAIWWCFETAPISVTSLLPMVLFPLFGVCKPAAAMAPYASDTIFLFMGAFILAAGVTKWGLDRRIALFVMSCIGATPKKIVFGIMLTTGTLSAFMSNTACAAMMVPVAIALVNLVHSTNDPNDKEAAVREHRFTICLLLALAYSASIGGMATLIGSPPNGIYMRFMEQTYGTSVSIVDWMKVGVPVAVMMFLVAYFVLANIMFRDMGGEVPGGREWVKKELAGMGKMSRGEIAIGLCFLIAAVLWFTGSAIRGIEVDGCRPFRFLNDAVIAMMMGVISFLIPVDDKGDTAMDWETANREISWDVLLLFGGGLSLAAAIQSTGVAALIGADLLILMSDIDGLFTDDPNSNPDARFIDIVENMDDNMRKLGKSSTGSNVGTGGMATKLTAAIIATAAGADMVIANGNDFHNIHRIVEGKNCGTLFVGNKKEEFFLIDYIEKLL